MPDVRLIDANALRKNLSSRYMNELYPDWRTLPELTKMRIEMLSKEFRFALDHAPTIDAVPVVRCRECKHRVRTNSTLGFGWCGKFGNVMRDTDFCSWGERNMDGGTYNG